MDSRLEKLSNSFLINILFILIFGLIMVFSASYMYAHDHLGSSTHFLFKQSLFILFGCVVAFILSKSKISFWHKHAYIIHAIVLIPLVLTLIPGIGVTMKGSHRWINMGFMTLQPGEFVKMSLILVSIKYFENYPNYSVRQRLLYLINLALPLLIFLVQPDFGTFAISFIIICFVAYLSHFPRKWLYTSFAIGFAGLGLLLIAAPYRMKRVLVFLDPWSDPKNAGFQIIQSFLAFAHGSLTGQGLGNSHEKLFYLPEAYNDFIFSVVGEELGFFGVLLGVGLFIVFIFLGFMMALQVKSRLSALVISTIVFTIGFQAFLNMGVVLGLLPTKGLNLPLVSYGGSSMLANLAALGLVFAAIHFQSSSQTSGEMKNVRTKRSRLS